MTEETKLNDLKFQLFDPKEDSKNKLPNSLGNYIIVLRETATLPDAKIKPIYTTYNGYNVIYTGISSKNLRDRDYEQHFTGNNAGRSTLRKSLGCLFGYKQIPRDEKNLTNGKTKFEEKDEKELSNWMQENLLVFFLSGTQKNTVEKLEEFLIKEFNPPLNIQKNKDGQNKEYVKMLKSIRNNK